MQAIHLTHYTATSCLGTGLAAMWQTLAHERTGLKRCDFETVELNTFIGEVPQVDDERISAELSAHDCRNNRLTQLALKQDGFDAAVQSAKARYGAHRVGIFLGTSTAGILQTELAYRKRDALGALPADFHYAQTHNTYSVAGFVRDYFQLAGPAVVVSSACSSSAKVFGNAARMLNCGLIDAAIVGGVDSLCLTTLYGFNSLELLSPERCTPYGADRKGISIAEAAAFALLTRADAVKANDIVLLGVGESSDAHHMSSPHPEGAGARAAMEQALHAAKLSASQIDYINLHGTATPSNDAAEDKAVHSLFADKVPCSSTKGATGHTLGAAGGLEAVICALALTHDIAPGGVNTTVIDTELKSLYQLKNLHKPMRHVLSNSFGFGGSNCSLVLAQV
jgi:3-oxoacyl-[acyl-carrier-protein] synthase I